MITQHKITLTSANQEAMNKLWRVKQAIAEKDGTYTLWLEEKTRDDGYVYKRRIRAQYKRGGETA